jgi:hypothetical protein
MKKCPYCAEEIQDEAIICRYCNREISGFEEVSEQVNSKPEKKRKERGVFLPALLFGLAMGAILFSYNLNKPIEFPEYGFSGHLNNAFMMGVSSVIIYGVFIHDHLVERSFLINPNRLRC